MLSAAEAAERVRVDHLVLGSFNPHCARVQPAKLARGLADVVERLGVTIYEQTTVTDISPGRAETTLGVVRAPIVLRATEGFTARMRGLRRRWLPMNSAMIATEPISGDLWQSIGWAGRETMGDLAHGFFYAQRTADDRIAIGGRAVPYRYASRIDKDGVVGQGTIDYLTGVLNTILPQTRGVPIAHGWCGVLAVPRTGRPGEPGPRHRSGRGRRLRRARRHRHESRRPHAHRPGPQTVDRTDRAAVGGAPPKTWEPEPLRWLGVRGMYSAYKVADRHEAGGRSTTSPIAVVADKIAGRPQPADGNHHGAGALHRLHGRGDPMSTRPVKEPTAEHPITVEAHRGPGPGPGQRRGGGRHPRRTGLARGHLPCGAVHSAARRRRAGAHPERHPHLPPVQGEAGYYNVTAAGATVADAIWTYEQPYPAVAAIAGHVAFYPDKSDITVEPA